MKIGDRLTCPECGEKTVVKSRPEMDGWNCVGEVFACALCGAKLGDNQRDAPGRPAVSDARDRLAAFLGAKDEAKPELKLDERDRRFCRICAHVIRHPFFLKCSLTGSEVDPVSDCENFIPEEKGV